ncbi:GDP-mannose 4,6-dehydratase [Vibrio sp. DW001]|uniref:GDP-mannose 4,6-dehydratase n=1 Tax=Vibrio sp. DW001 TaxID=2912315 RepID=UPI0023AEC587|nr:GDP-mannose 4,6-dehydratase [Vibrio sp. DW001]WED26877.1 GDP-mannose 4,6-dehydratase [Vibrio sp. DW001]
MSNASRRVLIFGIDGFTGNHLAHYLSEQGHEVLGTSYSPLHDPRVFKCDICDKNNVLDVLKKTKPNYIVNLAGISFVANKNDELFYNVNVLAVENILSSILEVKGYSPEKIILVSSASVYGAQPSDILDESMQPNPMNHYGISKFAMEQMARTYFTRLNIIITRPFNYTGVGQKNYFLIPKIVEHYKNSFGKIELGNLNISREFNDIDFVCEAYNRLLELGEKSNVYNICSNKAIKLIDIINIMNEIAGYKIKVETNEKFLRKNDVETLTGSSDKLFDKVSTIENPDFRDTLKKMYES